MDEMPFAETLTPREIRGRGPNEDTLGLDRLARSFLRTVVRQGPGVVAHVQGAPGSGKTEFLRRCAHVVEVEREALGADVVSDLYPHVAWLNAWSYARQGTLLAGLVATIAQVGGGSNPVILDRARDLLVWLSRVRFDGSVPEAAGAGLAATEADPIERVRRGFGGLVDAVKGGTRGRLMVFVTELEPLPPAVRMAFLEGVRLLVAGCPDVAVVLALGREASVSALRVRDPGLSDAAAVRVLDELVDLAITVPKVDIRRIGGLVRRYLGQNEIFVRRAFGEDAVNTFVAALAHRTLGTPRFLERLAMRVVLLADYTLEARAMRVLTETQWSWVVVVERWPDFRRFMIRGGPVSWGHLRLSLGALGAEPAVRLAEFPKGVSDLAEWLRRDPLLAEYLRMHGDGFEQDSSGVALIEDLLLQAGL